MSAFLPRSIVSQLKANPTFVEELNDEVLLVESEQTKLVSTICPHNGGFLQLARNREHLVCSFHGWEFSLDTGRCINRKSGCTLKLYEFRTSSDGIEVRADT